MGLEIVLTISFFIISILGTVFHFTHQWFKKGILLHIFSAVNESTSEHMKLLVFPTLLVTVFQYFAFRELPSNFFYSVFVLYIVEVVSIPLLYEPLRMLFKRVHFGITILIFYISISVGIYLQYIVLKNGISLLNESISILLIILLTSLFGIFTYFPPKIFLFKDPVTGRYGDTGKGR